VEKNLFQIAYYMNGVVFFVGLYATILGLINIKKIGFYSIFTIILVCSLMENVINTLIKKYYTPEESNELIDYIINCYLIIELIILSIFFYKINIESHLKKILLVANVILITFLCSIFFNKSNLLTEYHSEFAGIEAIIILLNCIILFVQILNDELNLKLTQSSDFLITSGIFFLFSFTCPFYILYNYTKIENSIFFSCFNLVNSTGYLFFHISIILAFKCKIRSKKILYY